MKKKANEENLHAKHRIRLKARFLKDGIDGFEDHNKLELLLCFCLPQGDVNEVAHRLLNQFGSIAGVFDAPFEELCAVKGIKEHSATFFKIMPQIARQYYCDYCANGYPYDHVNKIEKYLINKYIGISVETVYLMSLNNKYELLDCSKVYTGSVNSVAVEPRPLIEIAIRNKAAMVVLSHNHPNGLAIPSSEDLTTTANLKEAFRIIGIPMVEHILVAGDNCKTLVTRSTEMLKQRPEYRAFYSGIDFERFYGEENNRIL